MLGSTTSQRSWNDILTFLIRTFSTEISSSVGSVGDENHNRLKDVGRSAGRFPVVIINAVVSNIPECRPQISGEITAKMIPLVIVSFIVSHTHVLVCY